MYGVKQIRWTPELDGGGADGSATPITSTKIQQMGVAPVYVDGTEVIQRGGDDIVAIKKEDDKFRGVDLTLDFAALEPTLKAAIAGGTVSGDKWSAPKDDTEMPFPGRLEVWQENETESDSESSADGFVKHEFSYCIGRLGSTNGNQQAFSNEQFVIRARRNDSDPSNPESAWTEEEVAAIV